MAARVLLVDDDSRIADTVRDILESLGYEMDWAKSQKEAEQFVGNKQYDCILLDREIPVRENRIADVEHGDILFDRFMHDPRLTDVPIIIVTGHDVGGPDRAVEMVKAGAFDYVTKPFKKKGKTLASVIMKAREARETRPSEARVPPCPLTVTGLASFVEVSEGTIRNTYKAAGVLGPKPGEHSRSFTSQDILLIARERVKSKRCSKDERARWNRLLTQLDQPTL